MTKAATEGEKRRRKAARGAQAALGAVCEISGVHLGAESSRSSGARPSASETVAPILSRMCALMDWPDTEANRKRVRNEPRIATLYGKLALDGRLGASEAGNADAYRGYDEYAKLDRQYRRTVLGAIIPGDSEAQGHADQDAIRWITDQWMGAKGVFASLPPDHRAAARFVLEAGPDVPPASVSTRQSALAALAGLALARHFGLRT